MISGFLTSVISSLRPRQHIEERLTLIIDFYHLLLLRHQQQAFDKRTNLSQYRWRNQHARYLARLLLSPAKSRKVTNELGDNGASLRRLLFVNAPPLYLPRRYAIANARVARCLVCALPREWRQQVMFFWHLHVLPPNKGFALFN